MHRKSVKTMKVLYFGIYIVFHMIICCFPYDYSNYNIFEAPKIFLEPQPLYSKSQQIM